MVSIVLAVVIAVVIIASWSSAWRLMRSCFVTPVMSLWLLTWMLSSSSMGTVDVIASPASAASSHMLDAEAAEFVGWSWLVLVVAGGLNLVVLFLIRIPLPRP